MGTRGIYGFHKNGVDKLTYKQFDSYPDGLGQKITKCINEAKNKWGKEFIFNLNKVFDNIIIVNEDDKIPNSLNIKEKDWYTYLRPYQGDLQYIIDQYTNNNTCYMIDNKDFIKDSLFCEWGYIINLTTNKFEIYEGYQTSLTSKHRYYIETPTIISSLKNNYYNCELVKEYSLTKLPKSWFKNYNYT